jgi:flagellar motor switch protein FliN/FliY
MAAESANTGMSSSLESPRNLEVLFDIPVQLSVELGSCQLPMKEVLQLEVGSVVRLDKEAEAPVELYVNEKLVARGEVVIVDDHFGIKVTEIIGKKE